MVVAGLANPMHSLSYLSKLSPLHTRPHRFHHFCNLLNSQICLYLTVHCLSFPKTHSNFFASNHNKDIKLVVGSNKVEVDTFIAMDCFAISRLEEGKGCINQARVGKSTKEVEGKNNHLEDLKAEGLEGIA